jgi:pimeloyl-ACP methyl ester carboxylesterase
MKNNVFQLPDKRKLGYALYGPINGEPVFYFHGTPSSRLEPLIINAYNKNLDELLQQFHLHLIAVDRPGMGLSDFNPVGDFHSFAHDVYNLAAYLKVSSAKVLCWSGGGPFALTLAFYFSQLIKSVYIITGFTQSFVDKNIFKYMHANKYYFFAAKKFPWALQTLMNLAGKRTVRKPFPRFLSGLPHVDYKLLDDVKKIKHFSGITLHEACRQGSDGSVYEAALYFKPTGYHLSKLTQPVHFWWGNLDRSIIAMHPRALEKLAPRAVMHYKQNEGHLSVYINYIEEVLQTIEKT